MSLIVSKSAVVYFARSPFPVKSGSQWRCASVIRALMNKGYQITLVVGDVPEDFHKQSAYEFGIKEVLFAPPFQPYPAVPTLPVRALRKALRLVGYVHHSWKLPENLTFPQVLEKYQKEHGIPDVLVVTHADNTWIRQHLEAKIAILDVSDLISVSNRLFRHAMKQLVEEEGKLVSVAPGFVELAYYQNADFEPAEEEVEGCRGYDAVLMIAEKEQATLSRRIPEVRTTVIPPTVEIREWEHGTDVAPLFAAGPNPFNIQGLLLFKEKILPLILESAPDFQMVVTGDLLMEIPLPPEIRQLGLVPDLNAIYRTAGFAVVPTFGGTGQQIKVIEAMGAGLAVVAFNQRVDSGTIEDGVDGFLASDEAEFAEKVVRLWLSPELRERMGKAAREKARKYFSQDIMNQQIEKILYSCEARNQIRAR